MGSAKHQVETVLDTLRLVAELDDVFVRMHFVDDVVRLDNLS